MITTLRSTIILEKLPAGSRIAVMADTRWAESPAERCRFKLSPTNLVRALSDPPDRAAVDQIVMPVSIMAGGGAFFEGARHAERVNAWLNRGPSVLASGDRPMKS